MRQLAEQQRKITKAADEAKKKNAHLKAAAEKANQYAWATTLPRLSSASTQTQGPAEKELPLAFETEPIVAHRAFRVIDFGTRHGTEKRLAPVNAFGGAQGHYPTMKRMEAFCNHHMHEAPFKTCQCGVWALKKENLKNARAQYGHQAYGEVYLWGRVLQGENGYRAQYAYPKHLWAGSESLAKELQVLYGVPVDVDTKMIHAYNPLASTTPGGLFSYYGSSSMTVSGLTITNTSNGGIFVQNDDS